MIYFLLPYILSSLGDVFIPLSDDSVANHKLTQQEQEMYISEGVTLLCISLFLYDSGCNGTLPPSQSASADSSLPRASRGFLINCPLVATEHFSVCLASPLRERWPGRAGEGIVLYLPPLITSPEADILLLIVPPYTAVGAALCCLGEPR